MSNVKCQKPPCPASDGGIWELQGIFFFFGGAGLVVFSVIMTVKRVLKQAIRYYSNKLFDCHYNTSSKMLYFQHTQ